MAVVKSKPRQTRQREWQDRMVKEGRCRRCGKPRDGFSKVYCAKCRRLATRAERRF